MNKDLINKIAEEIKDRLIKLGINSDVAELISIQSKCIMQQEERLAELEHNSSKGIMPDYDNKLLQLASLTREMSEALLQQQMRISYLENCIKNPGIPTN